MHTCAKDTPGKGRGEGGKGDGMGEGRTVAGVQGMTEELSWVGIGRGFAGCKPTRAGRGGAGRDAARECLVCGECVGGREGGDG